MLRVFPNATNGRIIWACKLACGDKDIENNQIKSGEKILIAGFGVGLSFSVCILQKNSYEKKISYFWWLFCTRLRFEQ